MGFIFRSHPRAKLTAGDMLSVRSVKLFGDGALGSRGAALLEDYSDQPGWRGFLLRPEDSWKQLIKDWFAHVSVPPIKNSMWLGC